MDFLENYKHSNGPIKYYCLVAYKALWKYLIAIYVRLQRWLGGINDNDIVFLSTPDYSDNAKALSEYLEVNGYAEKYNLVWLVGDIERCKRLYHGKGVTFLPRYDKYHNFPFSSLKIYLHAHYLISTHGSIWHKGKAVKGQVDFCLWHGCGYKDKNTTRVCDDVFDKCLVPGPLFVKTKARYFRISEDFFLPIGYPRYDWLLHPGGNAQSLRMRLLGNNTKLVVWMPTFRNVQKSFAENIITQFPIMANDSDWFLLDKECQRRNVVLVIKLHPLQKKYDIKFDRFNSIINIDNNALDSLSVNLYEFLAVTDGLISDYSSVSFDYLIVNKPIAYTLDDFELYKGTRGFVFDNPKDYMPGHHLYNIEDLISFVDDISKGRDSYISKRLLIKQEAIHESSHYCQDVVSAIGLTL